MFRRPRPGLRAHVREAGSVCRVLGDIRVSEPAQLFVELASSLSFVDAVVAGDAMVRLGLITLAELRAYCAKLRGKHSRTARRLVRYVREGVDSPMETRLRLLLVLAGLPEPEVNHLIRDEWGAVLRRLDLAYPALKLIIEFDGRHHIEREQQWEADIERRESLDSDGWRTLVVTSAGIYRDPTATVEKVRRALQSRGVRVGSAQAGLPVTLPWPLRSRAAEPRICGVVGLGAAPTTPTTQHLRASAGASNGHARPSGADSRRATDPGSRRRQRRPRRPRGPGSDHRARPAAWRRRARRPGASRSGCSGPRCPRR